MALNALALVALILGGTVAAAGTVLYVTDYPVEATIIKLDCNLGPGGGSGGILPSAASTATLRTKILGVERTVDVPSKPCNLLEEGDFVQRHIRTGRTVLYDSGGDCVYDTEHKAC